VTAKIYQLHPPKDGTLKVVSTAQALNQWERFILLNMPPMLDLPPKMKDAACELLGRRLIQFTGIGRVVHTCEGVAVKECLMARGAG